MPAETILTPATDRSLFSMHPEDWVTQQDSHDEQSAYFKHANNEERLACAIRR